MGSDLVDNSLKRVIFARIEASMKTGTDSPVVIAEAKASVDYMLERMAQIEDLDLGEVDVLSLGIGMVMAAEMLVSVQHGWLDQTEGDPAFAVMTPGDLVKAFARTAMSATNGLLLGVVELDEEDR